MTNDDCKGRIFLSNSHTNNEIFFLLITKYLICIEKKREKRLPKILNTLRCDMVTLF